MIRGKPTLYKCPSPLLTRANIHRYTWSTRAADRTMRVNTLFFLTITACVCLALAQITYDDCCLKYMKEMKPRTQKYAVNYRWQVLDGGCNLSAVIFIMKRGRVVCTDPKEQWVAELMRQIDARKLKKHSKTSTKHNSRG